METFKCHNGCCTIKIKPYNIEKDPSEKNRRRHNKAGAFIYDPITGKAVVLLKNWRKHLGFAGSHDLLRRIYREGLVLEKYQLALGDQARYNLMRLFDLALSPEMAGTPTVRRLAPEGEPSPQLGALAEQAVRDPMWSGQLVSADGRAGAVLVHLESSDSAIGAHALRVLRARG